MLHEIVKVKEVHLGVKLDGDMSVDTWFQKKLRAHQGVTGGKRERHVANVELGLKSFLKPMVECHVVINNQ